MLNCGVDTVESKHLHDFFFFLSENTDACCNSTTRVPQNILTLLMPISTQGTQLK